MTSQKVVGKESSNVCVLWVSSGYVSSLRVWASAANEFKLLLKEVAGYAEFRVTVSNRMKQLESMICLAR